MLQITTELMDLLPEWYATVADYQEIMDTEKSELDQLALFVNAVHDNFFIQTLDEGAVSDWENLLGIADSGEITLEFRRARILNRITMKPPFTLPFLYQKLDELIGQGKWSVITDYEDYTIYVESAAESQAYAVEVAYTINHIKPAHIVYINRPLITEVLNVNETVYGSSLVYNYRLGGWALGRKAFRDRGEEVLYKMATARSITPELLGDVAGFLSGDIVSARLNDTVTISDLTKTTTENVLTVLYTVPTGQLTTINKIELLDSDGNALTTATVYIPVSSELEIKHTFLTQEAVNG